MDLEKLEKDLLNLGVRVGIPKKKEKKIKGMFKHNNLKPRVKVFEITKKSEYNLVVPPLGVNHQYNFEVGIYEWEIKNNQQTIKFGLFGEGCTSNAATRYAAYRTAGKKLMEYLDIPDKKGNGSVVPMKVLNESLSIGESINVYFYEVINGTIYKDGVRYDIHLATIEKEAKNTKDTLLLS